MCAKEPIATIKLAERIILAIIGREREFVVTGNSRGLGFRRHVREGWRHVDNGGGRWKWSLHDR